MLRKIEGNSYNSPSEQLKIYYELDGGWNELFLGKMIILRSKGDMNMKRFLGMMPSTEIEIEKCYKDKDGYKIIIQAGKNGWTIIYADYSTDFKDIISSANKNFEEAYNLAANRLGTLTDDLN